MIDCSDLMDCVYGYCRWKKDFVPPPPPGKPLPDRTVTEQDYEWKWRTFYDGIEQSVSICVSEDLVEYLESLGGWYDREVRGDLGMAVKQVDDPSFLEGVSECYESDDSDEDDDE